MSGRSSADSKITGTRFAQSIALIRRQSNDPSPSGSSSSITTACRSCDSCLSAEAELSATRIRNPTRPRFTAISFAASLSLSTINIDLRCEDPSAFCISSKYTVEEHLSRAVRPMTSCEDYSLHLLRRLNYGKLNGLATPTYSPKYLNIESSAGEANFSSF